MNRKLYDDILTGQTRTGVISRLQIVNKTVVDMSAIIGVGLLDVEQGRLSLETFTLGGRCLLVLVDSMPGSTSKKSIYEEREEFIKDNQHLRKAFIDAWEIIKHRYPL